MKYLADLLSLLRVLSLVPVVLFSLTGEWRAAFIVLLIGWATDLLDGAAARRFGSLRQNRPTLDVDGLADTVLAFGSTVVPVIYITIHSSFGWLAWGLYALTVISGAAMVLVMNRPPTPAVRLMIAVNMLVFHGIVQIGGAALWFGHVAYGTAGIIAATAILAVVAWYQLPKMQRWLSGAL